MHASGFARGVATTRPHRATPQVSGEKSDLLPPSGESCLLPQAELDAPARSGAGTFILPQWEPFPLQWFWRARTKYLSSHCGVGHWHQGWLFRWKLDPALPTGRPFLPVIRVSLRSPAGSSEDTTLFIPGGQPCQGPGLLPVFQCKERLGDSLYQCCPKDK